MSEDNTEHAFEVLKVLQRDIIKSREIGPGNPGPVEGMANRISVKCHTCGEVFSAKRLHRRSGLRPGGYLDTTLGSNEIQISCQRCKKNGTGILPAEK